MRQRRPLSTGMLACLLLTARFSVSQAQIDPTTRDALRASGKVGEEVIDSLDADGTARVIVSYSLPGSVVTPKDSSFDAHARAVWEAAISAEGNRLLGILNPADFTLNKRYGSARAFAGNLTADGAQALVADPSTSRIDIDGVAHATLAQVVPFVGLNAVHGLGFTGQGVTVGVVDTGIDETHPDLSDNLVAEQCFCTLGGSGCCPDGSGAQSGGGSAYDSGDTDDPDYFGFSHGTYTSSIVSSRGVIAPPGTAPDAAIVSVKVLRSSDGSGDESGVLTALDWILHNRPDVRVVNMSLGILDLTQNGPCDNQSAGGQAFADVISTLRFVGVAVFVASGNEGSVYYMSRPACVSSSISVAASYDDDPAIRTYDTCYFPTPDTDEMACFSDATPRTKLAAPGVLITASDRASGTRTASGTSAATPVAAGCAATLLQAAPTLTVPQLELALENAPRILDERSFQAYPGGLSFPRLDCVDALNQVLGGQGLCPATARTNCRHGAYPHVGSVYMRKNTGKSASDSFKWYWLHGQQTSAADFGLPDSTTSFSVCAYDQGGSHLVMNLFAPAGGSCASHPCWTKYGLSGGWRYKDKLLSPSGISSLTLTPGSPGYASVRIKGSGANLRAPTPPLIPPLRMQLINQQNSLCFESTFSTPYANGGTGSYLYFKDSGD